MSEDWMVCDSIDHVGDNQDETVEWRDLGLMCEACYEALGDMRGLKVENTRLRNVLREIADCDSPEWRGDPLAALARAALCRFPLPKGIHMLQIIDDKEVYVVEFDTLPELPITWDNEDEMLYAIALGAAINDGIITEPGKYGIAIKRIDDDNMSYDISRIDE